MKLSSLTAANFRKRAYAVWTRPTSDAKWVFDTAYTTRGEAQKASQALSYYGDTRITTEGYGSQAGEKKMRRRGKRARKNPLSAEGKQIVKVIAIAAGAGLVIGGVGYYVYAYNKKKQLAAATTTPSALPGATKPAGSNVFQLTLSPGQMSTVPMSASKADTLSLFAPTGAMLGNVTVNPAAGVLASPASGANYEYVASATGNATITVNWLDVNKTAVVSTIPVVVSA